MCVVCMFDLSLKIYVELNIRTPIFQRSLPQMNKNVTFTNQNLKVVKLHFVSHGGSPTTLFENLIKCCHFIVSQQLIMESLINVQNLTWIFVILFII
jgi:hypothetical protein